MAWASESESKGYRQVSVELVPTMSDCATLTLMILRTPDSDRGAHPYARSLRLMNDYRTIGGELLRYESSTRGYGHQAFAAFTRFREGVAFVAVEVLESYLEDLLDIDVSDDALFIKLQGFRVRSIHWALVGLLGAVTVGLYAASTGASLPLSLGVTVALAFPFAIVWHFAPRDGLTRRVGFAQILSHEIARRRGGDDGRPKTLSPAALLEKLVAHRNPSSARIRYNTSVGRTKRH
jgi:hypothetical protein